MLASVIPAWPCGNKVPLIAEEGQMSVARQLALCCVLNSFAYDFVVRNRITGVNLNKFIVDETPIPALPSAPVELSVIGARLCMVHEVFAAAWLELLDACPDIGGRPWKSHWAVDPADRLEARALSEAIVAHLYGLDESHFRWILRDCDAPKESLSELAFRSRLPAKGFWRTGIGSAEHHWRQAWSCDPEFRLPNLALVAFIELDALKRRLGGDLGAAVTAVAPAASTGGWCLPDRLRLRDYGLGQDLRSQEAQEVRPRLRRESSGEWAVQGSWGDCQRIAEELRALWASDIRDAPNRTSTGTTHRPGSEGDAARRQGTLFEGDE